MNSENKMPDNLSGVLLMSIVEADQEETKNYAKVSSPTILF
jgi:hypothetical protein